MSGIGLTRFKRINKDETLRTRNERLIRVAESQNHLLQLIIDAANEKRGIVASANNLLAPGINKIEEKAKENADLTKKLDSKQTVLANSLHVDAMVQQKELLDKVSKQAEIQKEYTEAVIKQQEHKINENTRVTLEVIAKTAGELNNEVQRVKATDPNNMGPILEKLKKQDENIEDLHGEIKDETYPESGIMSQHADSLANIQENIKKEIPSTSTRTPYDKSVRAELVSKNRSALQKEITDLLHEMQPSASFSFRGCSVDALQSILSDLTTLKTEGKTIPPKEYTKRSFDAYVKTLNLTSGSGLKDKKLKDRINLLLASHNSGNTAGLEEFMKLINNLYQKKEISKDEYIKFLEQWST